MRSSTKPLFTSDGQEVSDTNWFTPVPLESNIGLIGLSVVSLTKPLLMDMNVSFPDAAVARSSLCLILFKSKLVNMISMIVCSSLNIARTVE